MFLHLCCNALIRERRCILPWLSRQLPETQLSSCQHNRLLSKTYHPLHPLLIRGSDFSSPQTIRGGRRSATDFNFSSLASLPAPRRACIIATSKVPPTCRLCMKQIFLFRCVDAAPPWRHPGSYFLLLNKKQACR